MRTKIFLAGIISTGAFTLAAFGQSLTTNLIKRTSDYPNTPTLRSNDLIQIAQPDLGTNKNINWGQLRAQIRTEVTNATGGTNSTAIVAGTNVFAITNGNVITIGTDVGTNNAFLLARSNRVTTAQFIPRVYGQNFNMDYLTGSMARNSDGEPLVSLNTQRLMDGLGSGAASIDWFDRELRDPNDDVVAQWRDGVLQGPNGNEFLTTDSSLPAENLIGTIANARLSGITSNQLDAATWFAATNGASAGAYVGSNAGSATNTTLYNANVVTPQALFVMAPFISQRPYSLWFFTSADGLSFDYLGRDPWYSTSDIYAPQSSYSARDARFFKWGTNWYASAWNNSGRITILQMTNNWGSWTTNQIKDFRAAGAGETIVWPVHWFVNPNETNAAGVTTNLHAMTFQATGSDNNVGGWPNDLHPYESHLTNANDLTSWSTPVPLTGLGGASYRTSVWTNTIDHDYVYWNGWYYSFQKQEGAGTDAMIALARSTNLITGWHICPTNGVSGAGCTNNWAGWGSGYEGMSLIRLPNGDFRLYFETFSGGAMWASDCAAANFPLGPWGPKQRVKSPLPVSDPGFILMTNTVDIANVLSAKGNLSLSQGPFTLPHLPDYDVVYPANIYFGGTNAANAGWSFARLVDTNWNGAMMSMYIGTAAPAQFDFYQVTKGSGAINNIGTINGSGFKGGGSQLTSLNASQVTSGTLPNSVMPTTVLQATNGTGYTNTFYYPVLVNKPVWVMSAFQNGWPYKQFLCYSVDGINFDYLGPDPIISAKPSQIVRDARWLVTTTNIYLAATGPTDSRNSWVFTSTNYVTWTSNRVYDMSYSSGINHSWGPRWFVDATNGLHFITQQSTNGTTGFVPVESHLTNPNDFTSWSTGTEIAGWRNVWSNTIDHAFAYDNGVYWCFFKQEDAVNLTAGAYIGLASNASPVFTNTWSLVRSNNWTGWGVGYEAISLLRLPNGDWQIFFEQYSGAAMWTAFCPSNNFPFGFGSKIRLKMPQGFSNPGFLLLTNQSDIVQFFSGAGTLKRSGNVLIDIPHAPYHDSIFGANINYPGYIAGDSTWQEADSIDTNRSSIYFNFYTGTGNPEIDLYWYPKNGLAGGVRNSFGIINLNGWNGGVVGTTVSASGVMTATAGIGSKLTTTYSLTATGYTNNNTVSVRIIGLTGTSITQSNATSGNAFSRGTITTGVDVILQPGESVSGSSIAAQSTRAF